MIAQRLTITDAAASLSRNDAHLDHPSPQHSQALGSGMGQIDDPALHKGPAIINPNRYRSSVIKADHPDPGSKPQSPVGGRICVSIIGFAARRSFSLEAIRVIAGQTDFAANDLRSRCGRCGTPCQDRRGKTRPK